MHWMSHSGQPIAAAEDAAPIRREWEDSFNDPLDASLRSLLMSRRVRKEPLRNWKRGPDVGLQDWRYLYRAEMGQSMVLLAAIRRVTPVRKGSVFDDFMWREAVVGDRVRSVANRDEEGSYLCLVGEVYSDTRKNPKKAVRRAAHSINLST